ncbi:hypothetical protein [Hymenobacter siberiensis]|uniref:hypothetical protein n=1 Tax=Hymenobacter siberiensis TaxID=2848396 RepID=UPI001C1E5F5D|nr:hypothetical protein [Hymenobacter siberiensis]MBU6119492.1 hypothetical protein [Hymenobacter siberiensis]
MGHHVVGNTTRVDIARAESIVGIVSTLNPDVKESITSFVAEFYTVWANGVLGQSNFHDEVVKVGRTFKKLLDNNPDDAADLADAFCLAIRLEIDRIEDEASNYIPSTAPLPDSPQEIAMWLAAQGQVRKDKAVEILWGILPPFEEASTARNRAVYYRNKLGATIQLYQYARAFYEAHMPKQFAIRPNLPAYYTAPLAVGVQSISPNKSTTPATVTVSSKATIAELCISPFTPADLSNLLQHLRLIDSRGNCLTNDLRGKAQGLRSKFTAAYRVLHRRGLMDSTSNNAEWVNAFHIAYGAAIGETAQNIELTGHGKAAATSSLPFKKGVDEAETWVSDWRENQS